MRKASNIKELEKKCPMKYNEFGKKIKSLFLNEDEYYYGKKYAMKEKEEFLKNEDDFKQYYRNAADYYETGENKKFSDEDLFFVVESLSVGCHSYFYRKNSPVKLEKGKIPINYVRIQRESNGTFLQNIS